MLGYVWAVFLGLLYLIWMISTLIDIFHTAKSVRFNDILENLSEGSRMYLGFTFFVLLTILCLICEILR